MTFAETAGLATTSAAGGKRARPGKLAAANQITGTTGITGRTGDTMVGRLRMIGHTCRSPRYSAAATAGAPAAAAPVAGPPQDRATFSNSFSTSGERRVKAWLQKA